MTRNPMQLTKIQAMQLTRENVTSVKHVDCAFYNDCLSVAVRGNWKGFGCSSCTAYQAMDVEQKVQDILGIHAALAASENEEKDGCAGRKRGVRPGADAKVRRHLNIVPEPIIPVEDGPEITEDLLLRQVG